MSKQPAAKPKQPANKPTSRRTNSTSKDNKTDANKKEKENTSGGKADTSQDEEFARMVQEEMYSEQEESDTNTSGGKADTSQDEEFARMLQEEMYSEQEESDAAMARRLHEEERNKMRPLHLPPANLGPGGRPMSATPIQHLFRTLFHMQPQASELEEDDDDDDTTPAMDPEALSGATGTDRLRQGPGPVFPPRQRQGPTRFPERPPRGRGRSSNSRSSPEENTPDTPNDLLPGVRVNPHRRRRCPHPIGRRIFFNMNPQNNTEMEDESGVDEAVEGADRRIAPPPGLGPREEMEDESGANEAVEGADRRIAPPPGLGPREVSTNRQNNTEMEDESGADEAVEGADRRIAPPPGLGPREGTMAPPDGEYEPDLMILDGPSERSREDNFVHIMRDPFLLMLLLMGRDPTFMVPDDIDLGDYEALWDLAERLGEVQSRGMKEEDIAKLKPETYRKGKTDKDSDPDKCSVCLYEYKTGDKVIKLHCGHLFHQECLSEWLKRNATCPVCRTDVKKPS